jgi:hypothetical protein
MQQVREPGRAGQGVGVGLWVALLQKEHSGCAALLRDDKVSPLHVRASEALAMCGSAQIRLTSS